MSDRSRTLDDEIAAFEASLPDLLWWPQRPRCSPGYSAPVHNQFLLVNGSLNAQALAAEGPILQVEIHLPTPLASVRGASGTTGGFYVRGSSSSSAVSSSFGRASR